LLLFCYGAFCLFSPSEGASIGIPVIILAGVCLLPLVIQPQPWLWTYGFVIICLSFTSCLLLPAGIPLLIYWIKPEVKKYYLDLVATTSQLPPPIKVPEAPQPAGDRIESEPPKLQCETPTQDIADTTTAPVIRKRPTGVSVVGWILIVMGAVSLLSEFISAASTDYGAILAKNRLPVVIQVMFGFVGLVVTLFGGIYILKGASWARWLYIGWGAFAIPVSLANLGFSWLILPGLIFYALFTAVLLQKDSSAFFKASNEDQGVRSLHMEAERSANPYAGVIFVAAIIVVLALAFALGHILSR
jgi:hypothetical protein